MLQNEQILFLFIFTKRYTILYVNLQITNTTY